MPRPLMATDIKFAQSREARQMLQPRLRHLPKIQNQIIKAQKLRNTPKVTICCIEDRHSLQTWEA